MYTSDVGQAFSLINAISTLKILSFQIAIENSSDKYLPLSHLCKYSFSDKVKGFLTLSPQLCKTIEAACKLRYQKCLDARQPGN
jgi:hypothetical protein